MSATASFHSLRQPQLVRITCTNRIYIDIGWTGRGGDDRVNGLAIYIVVLWCYFRQDPAIKLAVLLSQSPEPFNACTTASLEHISVNQSINPDDKRRHYSASMSVSINVHLNTSTLINHCRVHIQIDLRFRSLQQYNHILITFNFLVHPYNLSNLDLNRLILSTSTTLCPQKKSDNF